MDTTGADPKVQAAACAYLLVGLMQRLEKSQPGLIKGFMAGVNADRRAIPPDLTNREFVDQIFEEALRLLKLADQVPRS